MGRAREVVDTHVAHQSLNARGLLADRGHSLREEHVHDLRLKASTPTVAVPVRSLETARAVWENGIRVFQNVTAEKFPEANRRSGVINMCPEKLRDYAHPYSMGRFPSYDLIKGKIVDWLVDEAGRGKISGGHAAALGAAGSQEGQNRYRISRANLKPRVVMRVGVYIKGSMKGRKGKRQFASKGREAPGILAKVPRSHSPARSRLTRSRGICGATRKSTRWLMPKRGSTCQVQC